MLLLCCAAGALRAQAPASTSSVESNARATTRATLAAQAPVIDGRDDDPAWTDAVPVTGFRVFDPVENGEPTLRTEARVVYDARNIYVLVRAFDPHPDSIVSLLSRRDVKTPSDQVKIAFDSYDDRRTGFEFAVNPAGVKRDYYVSDDVSQDESWDAVWEVGTRIDSLGWVAEFRIPLGQLRYPAAPEHVFGFQVTREIARSNERSTWPLYRRSVRGIVSQYGELTGLRGLGSPRRAEAAPYVVTRNVGAPSPLGFRREQDVAVGADVKLGLGSNLTLDLAVNPDFGQVEADPAELNLGAFETFLSERRPFFLEGTGVFRFASNMQMFYSRRIGRAPQLGGLVEDPFAPLPRSSTILGAAKLTGRLRPGTSMGILAATTQQERVGDLVVEPRSHFGVARMRQDFREGRSDVGVMFTGTRRDVDAASAAFLREEALTAGVDARHRFAGPFEIGGALSASRVSGSPEAIARTQRNSVHYYQRPDAGLAFDSTRTALDGTSLTVYGDKVTGAFRYGARYLYTTPGFELNDLGYLQRADWQWGVVEASYRSLEPRAFWRTASAFAAHWLEYDARGVPNANSIETGWNIELPSGAGISGNAWTSNLYPAYCDRCAFGGPAVRLSQRANLLVQVNGDRRKRVTPLVSAIYTVADEGRTSLWRVRPYVTVRARPNLTWEVGTRYQRNIDNTQYVGRRGVIGADSTHYLFARLDQHLLSFTTRLDYTVRPTLSVQLYAEPFVTTGAYDNVRELSDTPRAADYDARFRPTTAVQGIGGFNSKQFRSNAVLRWEYRPGSALFVVWQQGRDQDGVDTGTFEAGRDYRNLFSARPDNVFLVKASYWLSM